MARRYYFKNAAGRKVYRDSLAQAAAEGEALARKIGRAVAVGYDDVKAIAARKNPDAGEYIDHAWRMMQARASATAAARKRGQARKAKQLAPPKARSRTTAKVAPGKQGAAARRRGMSKGMNPYKAGSLGAHLWRDGWEKGR